MFDATKVKYDMYSCAISGMSRETMKMDGRDSAEYQNWEKKDIDDIIGFDLNDNNAKIVVFIKPKARKRGRGKLDAMSSRLIF